MIAASNIQLLSTTTTTTKREFIIDIEFILLMQPKATHGRLFIQCANDAFEKNDSPSAHWNRDSYRSSLRAWMLHVHIKGNWLSIRFLLCLEWIMLLDVQKCSFKDECKQAYNTKFIACTQHKGCQKAHRLAQLPKMNLPAIFIIWSSLMEKHLQYFWKEISGFISKFSFM